MTDTLKLLWDSTADLHERFGLPIPDTAAVLPVFREEVREFLDAMDVCDTVHAREEAADVAVMLCAVLMSTGASYEDFMAACLKVVQKNNAKTHETHAINSAGKIARKARGANANK